MGITKRQLDMTLKEWAANNGVTECTECGLDIEECICPDYEKLLEEEDRAVLEEE